MRILLDENMPRKLLSSLVAEGHEVDSVKSLQLAGIDNGTLYQMAASNYDLCFTRDAEFSRRVLDEYLMNEKSATAVAFIHNNSEADDRALVPRHGASARVNPAPGYEGLRDPPCQPDNVG